VKVFNQVQSVEQARRAVQAGVDLIAAQGTEAGGHTGTSASLPLVPAVVDVAGAIPVVAAGGIGDGRGLAAVQLLGAEGAWIGTRFVASREAASPDWAKQRVVAATADETVLTRAYDLATEAPFPTEIRDRVVRNAFTAEWAGRDDEVVARRAEVRAQVARAEEAGDTRIAAVRAGTVAGLIQGIDPAGAIVQRIVAEAEQLLRERPGQLLR
jgi:nitronate monooxygenase